MNEMRCTKENLSETIKYIEDNYELLEIGTIAEYFNHFSYFKITLKENIVESKAKKENSKAKCKHMYLEDYKLTIPKCNICGHEKYSRDGLGKAKMNGIEWKHQYQCEFISEQPEEINVTLEDAFLKYGIRKDEIGYDRGILFNRVAMRINKIGNYKVVEYLPRGYNSTKNDVDFYINIAKG